MLSSTPVMRWIRKKEKNVELHWHINERDKDGMCVVCVCVCKMTRGWRISSFLASDKREQRATGEFTTTHIEGRL